MTTLFTAGDSYTDTSGPWCPDPTNQYWHILAQHLGCEHTVNASQQRRSNNKIIQSVIQHCLTNLEQDTVYLINITNVFRKDIVADRSHTLSDILTPQAIVELDYEVLECELYAQLIGCIELLLTRNKKFYVINNTRDFSAEPLPMRDCYVNYIKNTAQVLNWFENSRVSYAKQHNIKPVDYDQYGWDGHFDAEGHKLYAEYLFNLIKSR